MGANHGCCKDTHYQGSHLYTLQTVCLVGKYQHPPFAELATPGVCDENVLCALQRVAHLPHGLLLQPRFRRLFNSSTACAHAISLLLQTIGSLAMMGQERWNMTDPREPVMNKIHEVKFGPKLTPTGPRENSIVNTTRHNLYKHFQNVIMMLQK